MTAGDELAGHCDVMRPVCRDVKLKPMTAAAKHAAMFLVVISAAISEGNEFVKSSKSANSQSTDDSHRLFLSFLKVS